MNKNSASPKGTLKNKPAICIFNNEHGSPEEKCMVKNVSAGPLVSVSQYGVRVRATLAAVAAALLFVMSGPAAAAVLTATDSSWKVTPSDPGAVPWNTDLAFNDSGWQNATVLYSNSAPNVSSAIWSSGGQYSSTELVLWARHTFTLSESMSSALLTYGCDDDCTIWVNGVQVVNDNNGGANGGSADILAQLQQGSNLIAFTASDNVFYGFNHAAWVQVDGEVLVGDATAAVPAMGPWTLALLAGLLVAVAGIGYRQRTGRKA